MLWGILLFLALAIVIYISYAYWAYNHLLPADLACRGLDGDSTRDVLVGGYHLYYRELGVETSQPPVVVLHGGPGHSCLSFKKSFDFLAADYRLIYYDQRGSGNSQTKPQPADYSIEKLVEELESLRKEIIQAEKIIVIGHSFGGALAQRYALRYPQHVQKMILVGSIRINNGLNNHLLWKVFGPALYSTALGFPPISSQAADNWFTKKSNDKDSIARLYDKSRGDILENTGSVSFATWRELSLSLAGSAYHDEFSRLQTETLFIYGAADSPFTGKPVADEYQALLPHCTIAGFEKSGHWPFLEEPERFQDTLKIFLAQ